MKVFTLYSMNPYPYWFYGRSSVYYVLLELSKYVEIHITFPVGNIGKEIANIKHLEGKGLKVYPFQLDTSDKIYRLLLNIFQGKPFKILKYYNKNYEKRIIKWIEQINPDIIQIYTPHMANYGFRIKNIYPNIPIMYRSIDILIDQIKSYIEITEEPLKRAAALWQLKKTLKYEVAVWETFNKSIFITKNDYNKAIKYTQEIINHEIYREKYDFILDGVQIEDNLYLENREKQDSLVFAASDQLQNIESVRAFIEKVWKPIYKKLKLNLQIYGKICGPLEKIYGKDYLKNLNVHLIGFISDIKELYNLIAKNKIFLSPTFVGSGYRTKIFEAGSFGMPILCSLFDYNSLPDDFKPNKNILVANDLEEFKDFLLKIDKDIIDLFMLSKNIHDILKNYSWENVAKRFINTYKDTMGQMKELNK